MRSYAMFGKCELSVKVGGAHILPEEFGIRESF
jgi:hypothetical protein